MPKSHCLQLLTLETNYFHWLMPETFLNAVAGLCTKKISSTDTVWQKLLFTWSIFLWLVTRHLFFRGSGCLLKAEWLFPVTHRVIARRVPDPEGVELQNVTPGLFLGASHFGLGHFQNLIPFALLRFKFGQHQAICLVSDVLYKGEQSGHMCTKHAPLLTRQISVWNKSKSNNAWVHDPGSSQQCKKCSLYGNCAISWARSLRIPCLTWRINAD